MSLFIVYLGIIVAICCLPHLITKIAVDLIAGLKILLKGLGKIIETFFKAVAYILMTPVRLASEIARAGLLLSRLYRTSYSKNSAERKKKDRQTKAMKSRVNAVNRRRSVADEFDAQFYEFAAKLKTLSEQSAIAEPIAVYTLNDTDLSTPTFLRTKLFQEKNGCLVRDAQGFPVKTSVATMFRAPDLVETSSKHDDQPVNVQPICEPEPTTLDTGNVVNLHQVIQDEIDLDEDGFDHEYNPYAGVLA